MSGTIIVGLKCTDGIVIGSDSQQEFGRGVAVKRLNTGKMYSLDDRFVFAGSGTTAHIEKAVDLISIALKAAAESKGGRYLDEDEIIDSMEKAMTLAHKTYNIDRSRFLEDPSEKNFFNPILICGCLEQSDGKDSPCLFIVHSSGIVEKINDYATAGSGAAYAELEFKNFIRPKITMREAVAIVIHVIDEVKNIDPSCGGITQIALISNEIVKELEQNEIINTMTSTEPLLTYIEREIIPRVLRGDIDEEKLRALFEEE